MRARLILFVALSSILAHSATAQWAKLKDDGLHDTKSPAIKEKQEPGDALKLIAEKAPDPLIGNQVRWVKALEVGAVNPRTSIWPDTKIRVLDQDIYLDVGGGQGVVRFPHKAHTLWLDCANCHDAIFKSVAGETEISMLKILEGEQCGMCHGAVAFPLTECARCHSVSQVAFPELEKRLGLVRVGVKKKVAR